MIKAEFTLSDGSTRHFEFPVSLDVAMRALDPHDMLGYLDDNTGLMRRTAPCFHDITRGPLWDTDVRKACQVYSMIDLWDCDASSHRDHDQCSIACGTSCPRNDVRERYPDFAEWCPESGSES